MYAVLSKPGKGNGTELKNKTASSHALDKKLKSDKEKKLFTPKRKRKEFSKQDSERDKTSMFKRKQLDFELNAPISLEQTKEMAMYYYLKWRQTKEPESREIDMKLKSYAPSYADKILTMLRDNGNSGKKARRFLFDAKKIAMGSAAKIVHRKKELLAKLDEIESQKKGAFLQLEKEKKKSLAATKEFYSRKDKFLDGLRSKKFVTLEKYMRIAVPLGGGIAAFIAGASPEIVAGAVAAGWLLLKGFKIAIIDWHLGMVKNRIPKREEKKIRKTNDKISKKKDQVQDDYIYQKKWHVEKFKEQRKAILEKLEKDYAKLLDKHSYWAFN